MHPTHRRSLEERPYRHLVPVGVASAGVVGGGLLHVLDAAASGDVVWVAVTVAVLARTIGAVVATIRRREVGVDVIAVAAMGGALWLGEYLAGAIIAVMVIGGTSLERLAVARARRSLRELVGRAPRVAHRRSGSDLVDVDVDVVEPGDVLVVKPGEVVPVDGVVTSDRVVLDESALTGEADPVPRDAGTPVRSGVTNAAGPFELRVTATAAESTYAGITRLVEGAEASKATFVRLADRYALVFLGLTIVVAGLAWLTSHDPIRALSVLVVATPCPLILAAPAAIIAGVSRAAKHGIIIKGGGPLEVLARTKVMLLDKTGTLTTGHPRVIEVETFGVDSTDELTRYAASVEQMSIHPYAPAIMAEAARRGLALSFPTEVHEQMGTGIRGIVDGRRVAVGQHDFVVPRAPWSPAVRSIARRTSIEGSASVFVSIEGSLAGAFLLQDPLRPEAPRTLRGLRAAGVERIHMVTGDHPDVAELVGDALGVDQVFAERTPPEKVDVVRQVRPSGVTAMIGDGINDAPALALADIGIAMGARGATAASEAADAVLMVDRLEGLLVAIRIAQRTRRIAFQSVVVGMGLSLVAMGFAAVGSIPPVAGAFLQEGIDVLVILNALRALGGRRLLPRQRPEARGLARDLALAHGSLQPRVAELAALASRLDTLSRADALEQLESLRDMLEHELLPHEEEEQRSAYPVLARMLRGEDPTGALVHTHHEIRRLVRLYSRLVDQLALEGPRPEDLRDLRRALYGLHATLTLHFAQEEELYSLLGSSDP